MNGLSISKKNILPKASDNIVRYMNDVSVYPLLSSDDFSDLFQKYKEGDEQSKQILINSNLRFVMSVVAQYAKSHPDVLVEDLISEGNIGLIRALEKFSPKKGVKFISFAVWWIRAYIHGFVDQSRNLVKKGQHVRSYNSRYKKAVNELTQKLERTPSIDEVAELMACKAEQIIYVAFANANSLPTTDINQLADLIDNFGVRKSGVLIADESQDEYFNDFLEPNFQVNFVKGLLSKLSDREAKVFNSLYGVNGCTKLDPSELSKEMKISRSVISTIHVSGLKKLKELATR
ncbi:MAG: sigma-70 family RNA polymerase sigma factor [Cyclobacteriaceae bacterium]